MLQTVSQGVYSFDFFGPEVIAGFSGREFDNSHHDDFLIALGLSPQRFVKPKQIHGSEIFLVDSTECVTDKTEADGLITQVSGLAIGIMTADCVPVYYWDPKSKIAGIAHAGWRGVHSGIVSKMIALFSKFQAGLENLQIAIGPCIRKCCYEVGEEFKLYFPNSFQSVPGIPKGYVDLVFEVKSELEKFGVRPQDIFDSGICTSCSNHAFFSARKDKGPERILSVIEIV